MQLYFWKGIDSQGKVKTGKVRAINGKEVLFNLHKQDVAPFIIRKVYFADNSFKKIKQKYIIVFTKKLESMLKAKVSIIEALEMLENQEKNKNFKSIIRGIRISIEEGNTLSVSFERYKDTFGLTFFNMVRAGEEGGDIPSALNELTLYMTKMEKIKSDIKRALTYPLIIFFTAIVLFFFIIFFIVPSFADIFQKEGAYIPYATLLILNISDFIIKNLSYIVITLLCLILTIHHFYLSKVGSKIIDNYIFNIPFIGSVYKKSILARFSRTIYSMLRVNVTVLQSLTTTLKSVKNEQFRHALNEIKSKIEEGYTLSGAIKSNSFFPSAISSMISIGEKSGQVSKMFFRVALLYEEELDESISFVSKIIEPIIMLVIGIFIGTLLLIIYLPIFKMAGSIGL